MAHGIILAQDVKNLIAEVYVENRKWPAHKIRAEVIACLHKDDKFQQYIDDPDWPRLSRIQKELHSLKEADEKRSAESKALDQPWSTISLARYPIPPEALPSILQVWVWIRENLKDATFSIREAQWVARLYTVTSDIAELAELSRGHSLLENIFQVTGKPFATSHYIDLEMFGLVTGQEITPERQRKIIGLAIEDWIDPQKVQKFVLTHKEPVYPSVNNIILPVTWKAFKKIEEAQNER